MPNIKYQNSCKILFVQLISNENNLFSICTKVQTQLSFAEMSFANMKLFRFKLHTSFFIPRNRSATRLQHFKILKTNPFSYMILFVTCPLPVVKEDIFISFTSTFSMMFQVCFFNLQKIINCCYLNKMKIQNKISLLTH